MACLILTLQYVHSKNVIHRDIKPENLIFDDKGYVHLTDFGIGKINSKDNSNDSSGTPGYMSPEVASGLNHSFQTDYFALGVIGYEFMFGKRPYHTSNRKQFKQELASRQVQISKEQNPSIFEWSNESVEFFNALLIRKQNKRLGAGGIKELMNHKWFNGYDWVGLYEQKIVSPFIFCIDTNDNYDKKYCNKVDMVGIDTLERYQRYMTKEGFVNFFIGYTYNSDLINEGIHTARTEQYSKSEMTPMVTQNRMTQSCNLEDHYRKVIPIPTRHKLFTREMSRRMTAREGDIKNFYHIKVKPQEDKESVDESVVLPFVMNKSSVDVKEGIEKKIIPKNLFKKSNKLRESVNQYKESRKQEDSVNSIKLKNNSRSILDIFNQSTTQKKKIHYVLGIHH